MKIQKIFILMICIFLFERSYNQNLGITSISSATACPGTIISLSVTLTHCPVITSIGLYIEYDGSVLSAIQSGDTGKFITNLNQALGPLSSWVYNQNIKYGSPGTKRIIAGWTDPYGLSPDSDSTGNVKLFDVLFRYYGGTTSLVFNNSIGHGGDCVYADSVANEIIDTPTVNFYHSGQVSQIPQPVIQGIITGNPSPCIGSQEQFSIAYSAGITYSWSAPSTWVGSSTSNSITYLVGGFTTDTIFVTPSNVCGSGNAVSLIVTANTIPVLSGAMAFTDTLPCISTYQTYSVINIAGVTYTWSAPSTWIGTSTSNSITYLVGGFTTDTIFVTPSNVCGTGNVVSLIVTASNIPILTGTIAFTDTTPCISTYQTFSVMNIPGTIYIWTAPSTWIGTSTSNSITYQVGQFSYDTVFVTATNSCGTSSPLYILVHDCSLNISGNYLTDFTLINYPNPFTDKTSIDLNLPEPGFVTIDVFNIFGEHLLSIKNNYLTEGKHDIGINLSTFADGIYYCKVKYRFKGREFSKMVLMSKV